MVYDLGRLKSLCSLYLSIDLKLTTDFLVNIYCNL